MSNSLETVLTVDEAPIPFEVEFPEAARVLMRCYEYGCVPKYKIHAKGNGQILEKRPCGWVTA